MTFTHASSAQAGDATLRGAVSSATSGPAARPGDVPFVRYTQERWGSLLLTVPLSRLSFQQRVELSPTLGKSALKAALFPDSWIGDPSALSFQAVAPVLTALAARGVKLREVDRGAYRTHKTYMSAFVGGRRAGLTWRIVF